MHSVTLSSPLPAQAIFPFLARRMDCSKLTADHEHMDLMIDKLRAECSDTGASGSQGLTLHSCWAGTTSGLSSSQTSTFDQMMAAGAASLCVLHLLAAHGYCLHFGDCRGLLLWRTSADPSVPRAEVINAAAKGRILCELLQELQDCMLPHLELEESMTSPERMKGLFSEAEMRQLHP